MSLISATAAVLSLQIEQALEANQMQACKGRFIKILDGETNAFMQANMPAIDLQKVLEQVKLSTELVQKYLGPRTSSDLFQGFPGKEMTLKEIRQHHIEVISDEFDDVNLPSLEEILSESHANAVNEDQITTIAKDFEEDRWPFNGIADEPKEPISGPWAYLASFGAPYVASLLSLDIAQALEADIEQMTASGEAPSAERMAEVGYKAAEKFIQANFETAVNIADLLAEVELPIELVQKYITSITFAEGCRTVSLKEIRQQMEPSSERFFDRLSQELDEVLPSLESHFEEASAKANVREAEKKEAEYQAAKLAAEQYAKSVAASEQSWLPSLPWLSQTGTAVAT
jgi:hypothetical protein